MPSNEIAPSDYAAAETLKNGLAVTVRALRPGDREKVARAVRGLERESIYYRLFSHRGELTEAGLDRIMRFHPEREVVLLATTGSGAEERVIGSARYVVLSPQTADVAFMVEEDHHGQGVASRLLRHLAKVGRAQGITTFQADVLAENRAMRGVFARTGWPMETQREGGAVHIVLTLPEPDA
ncbi:MAG TPA: GNAT family N-acetyltransferase [Caldimonas sp.]|nr:GNAT family N-acetyltransferase [Caldimonas sp.]